MSIIHQAHHLRVLRYGNLRDEAAAVLLGHQPVQGEVEAGEVNQEQVALKCRA